MLSPSVEVGSASFVFREIGAYGNAVRQEVLLATTGGEPGSLLGSVARLAVGRATWSATADRGDEVTLRWVGGFGDRHAAALFLLGGQAERDWQAREVQDRLHAPVAAMPAAGLGTHPVDAGPVWDEAGDAPWFGPLAAQEDPACGTVSHRHFTTRLRDGRYAVLDVAFYAETLTLGGDPSLTRVTQHFTLRLCGDLHDVHGTQLVLLRAFVQNVPFAEASDDGARGECERFRPEADVTTCEEMSIVLRGFRRHGTAVLQAARQ